MVMTTFTQFVQLKVSPGEFSMLLGYTQASFNRASPRLLYSGVLALQGCAAAGQGRAGARRAGAGARPGDLAGCGLPAQRAPVAGADCGAGRGVDQPAGADGVHGRVRRQHHLRLAGTFRHRVTLALGSAVAIAVFIAAQLLVEHAFNYRTTVGILVNLVCGTYFLALMVHSRGAA
jgi:iron complex transport system permease protein